MSLSSHSDAVESLAFSPDGKTLASGSLDNSIILWDMATRQPLGAPLMGHISGVWSVAFSPDGKTLASGSRDRNIILWDVPTRRPLGAPLTGHSDLVKAVAFSPDGKTLASGGNDHSVMLWDVDLESWKARICQLAGRNLTRAEWTQYFGGQGEPYHKTCEQWPEGQ